MGIPLYQKSYFPQLISFLANRFICAHSWSCSHLCLSRDLINKIIMVLEPKNMWKSFVSCWNLRCSFYSFLPKIGSDLSFTKHSHLSISFGITGIYSADFSYFSLINHFRGVTFIQSTLQWQTLNSFLPSLYFIYHSTVYFFYYSIIHHDTLVLIFAWLCFVHFIHLHHIIHLSFRIPQLVRTLTTNFKYPNNIPPHMLWDIYSRNISYSSHIFN